MRYRGIPATSDGEMGRPRGQSGHVEEIGGRVRRWRAHWFVYEIGPDGKERRRHRSRIIGLKRVNSTPDGRPRNLSPSDALRPVLTKHEAEEELRRIIARETRAPREAPRGDPDALFGWFWRNRWLPLREGSWRRSTREINLLVLERHLGPRWDGVRLRDITAPAAAKWLTELAEGYSRSLVQKCRIYLRAILEEAVEQGFLPRNPLRRLPAPRTRPEQRPALDLGRAGALLREMPSLRDRIILTLFLACGLRPGECFALRWNDVAPGRLRIDEQVVRGRLGEPKTRGSRSVIVLPQGLYEQIQEWRRRQEPASDEEFLFRTSTGRPLGLRNWDRDVLQPAAERAGIGHVNYQMLRRTFATLAHAAGIPLKVAQAQLRHSSLNTTTEVYTQVLPESHRAEIERFFAALLDNSCEVD